MTDLITRLSKLDAPDREVDAEIALQNGWQVFPGDNWIGPEGKIVVPEYTRSVDAAIALAERLFPGTEYEFTNLYNIVRVTIELNGEFGGFHGEHVNSLPIAICIALLRAKEASNP